MQRLCSQYKMYILIWLVFTNLSCSPLFAKGSLIKQSKLILLKQIHDNLSKERGTIQLKYCEFSGLTCRSFLEILNIQFRKCTFSRTFTNTIRYSNDIVFLPFLRVNLALLVTYHILLTFPQKINSHRR